MPQVFVSIGSNVEPERHVRDAVRALRERFGKVRVSPVYRTAAVGFDGADFLNLVVAFDTDLPIRVVDVELDSIERAAARDRTTPRFAPRTLDLDLLLYGDTVMHQDGIRVPRRELVEYAFMLRPLADLAPDLRHPQIGVSMRELLQAQDFSGQRCDPAGIEADSGTGPREPR